MTVSPVKRILMINLHSSRNAGDAALLQAAVQQLQRGFPGAQVTLAINDVEGQRWTASHLSSIASFMALFGPSEQSEGSHWHLGRMIVVLFLSILGALAYRITRRAPSWLSGRLGTLVRAYAAADLVVSCPGNIFFTMGRIGLPFLVSAFTGTYALLLGKPLYVMPQSIGPLRRCWERRVVHWLYGHARLVFAREPVSFRLLEELGLRGPRYRLVPDLAFALEPSSSPHLAEYLPLIQGERDEARVGVTIINHIIYSLEDDHWDHYEDAVAEALTSFLSDREGTAHFFPQVTGPTESEDDRVAARRVVARLNGVVPANLVDVPVEPALLQALYGHMDLFIATRMHSGIFAVLTGVPTLFIGYLHKTAGLVQMLGMEDAYVDIREVTAERLETALRALWARRVEIRQHYMNTLVPHLRQESARVGKEIAEDYYHE